MHALCPQFIGQFNEVKNLAVLHNRHLSVIADEGLMPAANVNDGQAPIANARAALRLVPGSGLGLLREGAEEKLSASFAALPPGARELARAPLPMLLVTKANTRSSVHRPGYTDYIGIKRYDATGVFVPYYERAEIEDDINNFKIYPILQLGLGFRF